VVESHPTIWISKNDPNPKTIRNNADD